MTLENFNEVVDEQIKYCLTVLAEKGKEYSLTEDRLDHFKDAAVDQECTTKQALWGMMSKHITSLNGMCKNESDNKEKWIEKITDSINYLLLLRAIVEEELSNESD